MTKKVEEKKLDSNKMDKYFDDLEMMVKSYKLLNHLIKAFLLNHVDYYSEEFKSIVKTDLDSCIDILEIPMDYENIKLSKYKAQKKVMEILRSIDGLLNINNVNGDHRFSDGWSVTEEEVSISFSEPFTQYLYDKHTKI